MNGCYWLYISPQRNRKRKDLFSDNNFLIKNRFESQNESTCYLFDSMGLFIFINMGEVYFTKTVISNVLY